MGQLVVRQCVTEAGRDRQQRVEPAPRLIDSLGDEIGGVVALEFLAILEWEVPLGEGHRSRIEPGVDHLRRALHEPAALALELVTVDERLMRIEVFSELHSGALGQFRVSSDCLGV